MALKQERTAHVTFGTPPPFPVEEITSDNIGGRPDADFTVDHVKYTTFHRVLKFVCFFGGEAVLGNFRQFWKFTVYKGSKQRVLF